jgi:hypothetical protein
MNSNNRHPWRGPLGLLAAAALITASTGARASLEPTPDPCAFRSQASCDAPGFVSKPSIEWRNVVNAREGQQLAARLDKVLAVAMQAPQYSGPRGISLHTSYLAGRAPMGAVKHHPVIVELSMLAKFVKIEDKGARQDKATGRWIGVGEGPALRMRFNDLGWFLSSTPVEYKDSQQFFQEPQKRGEVGGFPVYNADGKEVVLIHKRDVLPWRPFSVERYLQYRISEHEKTNATFAPMLPTLEGKEKAEIEKYNGIRSAEIQIMKDELARLTPEQRQAGACRAAKVKRGQVIDLDYNCGKGSTAFVEPNPDIFSPSAPKNSLQVLAVSSTWGVLPQDDRLPNLLGRVMRAALQDTDLKALQALLD